jgi:glycosyltransferase involved in cell wall biosynthesis
LFFVQFLKKKKKNILEIHSFHEQAGLKDIIFKYLLIRVDKVIVLANAAQRFLLSKYSKYISEQKIEVLVNGIEKDKIRVSKINSKNCICVGYIGSFYKWQGVYNFVEMVKIISDRYNTKDMMNFIMIGDGPEYTQLKKLIECYGLSKIITLTGSVAPKTINFYWDSIDIIVMPRPSTQATETTIPLKLMDAICANKVILASDVAGLTELLNNDIAVLYNKDSNEDLALNLVRLIQEPKRIEKLKINLSLFCKYMSNWEMQNKKLQIIYQNA